MKSGDLKLCHITVYVWRGILWCLLSTVNYRQQSLCFQAISSLGSQTGWAGSSALCWISVIQKELIGSVFYISQNIHYSCLKPLLTWTYPSLPPASSHSPFFSAPEKELFWDCHLIFYSPHGNKNKITLVSIPHTHSTFQQEQSCFPSILHETLQYPEFSRQNCQRVLGCFSLLLSKLFSATVSGTHCNEQSQQPEAAWCFMRRNAKGPGYVNRENSAWITGSTPGHISLLFSVFPNSMRAFCRPFQKCKFSFCFHYKVWGSEFKIHLLHAFICLTSKTTLLHSSTQWTMQKQMYTFNTACSYLQQKRKKWGSKSKVKKTSHLFKSFNSVSYLPMGPRSPESWLPASLGVLTDFEEGDIGVGTK